MLSARIDPSLDGWSRVVLSSDNLAHDGQLRLLYDAARAREKQAGPDVPPRIALQLSVDEPTGRVSLTVCVPVPVERPAVQVGGWAVRPGVEARSRGRTRTEDRVTMYGEALLVATTAAAGDDNVDAVDAEVEIPVAVLRALLGDGKPLVDEVRRPRACVAGVCCLCHKEHSSGRCCVCDGPPHPRCT